MSNKTNFPIPMQKAMRKLGKDISDARRRRRITMELMAERAGISRRTLVKIEKGEPTVSMGGYASVIFALGMTDRLKDLMDASYDLTGRELEEEHLPKRVRRPQTAKRGDSDE
ncbi:MAG: helix-turn-helix domain-containing protein [Alphaproteobacteria bacterium]|nr:helix-turn-helix domain-containing protein [Alphaproteobacteria bacterium]